MIRKALSIFFLSAYLISSTELNQLMKFPLFIKHFIEHKHNDSQLTLVGFIEMHYAHSNENATDYEEDMKLPFKSHDLCSSVSKVSFVPGQWEDFAFQLADTGQEIYSAYQDEFLPSASLSSIWQPPKFC